MTLAQLLVVQSHDSAIDRLSHRRATLPELEAIATIDAESARLSGERRAVEEQRRELSRAQKRLEDDAALITDRHDLETARLYDGSVTGHKELQAIQEELTVLEGRRNDLEDQILDLMEAGEPLDTALERFDQQLAEAAARRESAVAAVAAAQAEIDAEIAAEREQRAVAAEPISPGLIAEYEAVRAACAGIGVARLVDKTCEGCHLQLSAVEIDRIRKEPAEAMIRCPECTRILVR